MRDDVCATGSSMSQIGAPLPMRRWRTVIHPMSDRQLPENMSQAPAAETSDGSLVARSRLGDQYAATQLYLRYGGLELLVQDILERLPLRSRLLVGLRGHRPNLFFCAPHSGSRLSLGRVLSRSGGNQGGFMRSRLERSYDVLDCEN
jgi:hypothetical protein